MASHDETQFIPAARSVSGPVITQQNTRSGSTILLRGLPGGGCVDGGTASSAARLLLHSGGKAAVPTAASGFNGDSLRTMHD